MFISQNPSFEIKGQRAVDLKTQESQLYAGDREALDWGGDVEIACCAKIHCVQVYVYESEGSGFSLKQNYGAPGVLADPIYLVRSSSKRTAHYDVLQPFR